MVEAAGIEPSREDNTSGTFFEQKYGKIVTPEDVMQALMDTLQADPERFQNTFVREVCKIYAKWIELPLSMHEVLFEWVSWTSDAQDRLIQVATTLMTNMRARLDRHRPGTHD